MDILPTSSCRPDFALTGKVALVTGAAGLYGRPISKALASSGAHVVLASRSSEAASALAEGLQAEGGSAETESFDQGNERSVLRLAKRVAHQYGCIDILVNNAVTRPMHRWTDPESAWAESMKVNATGLFTMCRAFIEPMMARGSGCIINVGSIQSISAPDFRLYEGTMMTTPPDYHFHKHGMLGLTRYLAALAGPHGVRVNMISPGGLHDESQQSEFVERYSRRVALRRMANPEDIAGPIIFLASDAARYVTGINLMVDGGYSL